MLDTISNSIATKKLFSNVIYLVIIFTSMSMRMQQWGSQKLFSQRRVVHGVKYIHGCDLTLLVNFCQNKNKSTGVNFI